MHNFSAQLVSPVDVGHVCLSALWNTGLCLTRPQEHRFVVCVCVPTFVNTAEVSYLRVHLSIHWVVGVDVFSICAHVRGWGHPAVSAGRGHSVTYSHAGRAKDVILRPRCPEGQARGSTGPVSGVPSFLPSPLQGLCHGGAQAAGDR